MRQLYKLILLTSFFLSPPVLSQDAVTTSVENGKLEGFVNQHGVTAFLGIPYAASTAGDNRWRPPQALTNWSGVRPAKDFGPACIQPAPRDYGPWTAPFHIHGDTSEDCLSLNVWTPGINSAKHPVMVWIHGGGFISGANSIALYDGSHLAANGIVAVSVNYRLGVFGFMSHPQLDDEGPYSGEYGLLDQIAALKWVQANIAAFGGDPDNVTIVGQSADGASVQYLLSSILTKGLFNKAVMQSGGGPRGYVPVVDKATALQQGVTVQQSLKSKSIDDMRQIDAETLLNIARPVRFFPFLGNHFKTTIQHLSVPLIAGTTFDENTASQPLEPIGESQFNTFLINQFGEFAPQLSSFYSGEGGNYLPALRQARRDTIFASLTEMLCNPRCPETLFLYEFTHEPPGHPQGYGSFHSSELPYIFGTLAKDYRPYQQADNTLSAQMQGYWVAFMQASDPESALSAWPVYTKNQEIMRFEGAQTPAVHRLMSKKKESIYRQLIEKKGPVSVINY